MKFYQGAFDNNNKKSEKESYPDLPEIPKAKPEGLTSKKAQNKPNGSSSDLRGSIYLKDKEEEEEQTCFKKYCSCLQLAYYKDYYKVTNQDVKKRILQNLMFWKGGFFQPATQDYDFYGPFWIHTTVIFCLGAVHNILQYQGNPNYDYNFQILGEAFFAMYALGFGLPIGIGFAMKALGINVTIIQVVCLYGYSVSIYIFCVILCSFNICILHWIFLAYGVANKFFFIFKNINDGFQVPVSKKLVVTILIAIQCALQVLIFKVRFIKCADQVIPISTEKHFFQTLTDQHDESFVHFRIFDHTQIF